MAELYDVAVIGAGVFGAWTAYQLRRKGASVVLIDAYGPGNSRASSGGESRIIRLGYGPDEIYTRSAQRSRDLWLEMFEQLGPEGTSLFRQTGVLWLARENDEYCEATLTTLQNVGATIERIDRTELQQRYRQFEFGPIAWAILEPTAGALMARRAVQAVCALGKNQGIRYLQQAVLPISETSNRLHSIATTTGLKISANTFVFACGPWLPKLFPSLLSNRFYITRQEVFFFGVKAGDRNYDGDDLPIWIDFNDFAYGIPNLEGRGLKLAIDAHGPLFDPDSGERVVSASGLAQVRDYLSRRVPSLANAPVVETRVCQYENTANGDFLIDRHPDIENVWLVGGGSGHGFKHGPAVGEYVERMIQGSGEAEPRYSLATKQTVQRRMVY